MSNVLDTIQLSGSSYDLKDKNAANVSAVTQAEYDNLPTSAKTSNTLFVITDAQAGDLTQYWTSAQTQSAITQATSGKVDTTTFNTYSGSVETALLGKQDTLVSGTNIKTINNESILGSGNIDIQGGGGITSGEVQTMIDESISGKTDESAFTAHTADTAIHLTTGDVQSQINSSISGKQDTLSAGTGIDITDNVISATGGGGGGCTVDTTVIYDTLVTDLFDYQGVYKYEYTIVDYQGDKSSDTKGLFFIIGDASNDYALGYINLDYPNHSASTENTALTEYTNVEYISDIEDFKISVASAYQSTCWIKSIQNLYQTEIKVEYYKINSGSPCTAIETDVVGLIEKVKDTVDNSVKNASLSSQKDKLEFSYNPNKGYSVSFPVKLEELDGTDSILKPDIKVPLGVSGWTDFSLSDSCNVNNINGTKIRVTYEYETFNADSMSLTIVADVDRYEHYDNIYFDWNTQQPIYNGYFTGVTVSWSDTTKELVVEYPATIEESEEIKNVKISRLNSSYCQFGYSIIKVEAYGELTQGLKPYVQQLRSDANTISGEVQSKVSTSAVTSAVTSGSTDVVTSGGVYAKMGGMTIVKITESDYQSLSVKDPDTLYVVIPDPTNP